VASITIKLKQVFVEISQLVLKQKWGHTHTHTEHGDVVSVLFCLRKEHWLKMKPRYNVVFACYVLIWDQKN
jgi:hypothetical protein